MRSFFELFDDDPLIHIVDVGASAIDGKPPYQALMDRGKASVIGFEPNPAEFEALRSQQSAAVRFLPYAIGDGNDAELRICRAAGMSSLLEPDPEVLAHFHGFEMWGAVVGRERVSTRKLDDVEEIETIDYLKLDVQGGELDVLQGAARCLQQTLVVHLEVQFVPFYKNQPLFADLDQVLRAAGFWIHQLAPIARRLFVPVAVKDNIYAGLNQVLWAEAVYVKKFTHFGELSATQLTKLAAIVHDVYGSFDLASLALGNADRQDGMSRQSAYLGNLAPQSVQR